MRHIKTLLVTPVSSVTVMDKLTVDPEKVGRAFAEVETSDAEAMLQRAEEEADAEIEANANQDVLDVEYTEGEGGVEPEKANPVKNAKPDQTGPAPFPEEAKAPGNGGQQTAGPEF
jgi:hypothetical protein